MEKAFDNTDKKEYQSPALIEYGSIESLTHFQSGAPIDGGAPAGAASTPG